MTSASPRVSVLMSVFNTETFLASAIESVCDQTFQDLELIIIDDNSTDGGWTVVEQAAARDPRIIALKNGRSRGASGALNEGLSRARGTFITRQDSDDISLVSRIDRQVSFLLQNPGIGAVGTAVDVFGPDGRSIEHSHFPETDAELRRRLPEQMCFCGPTLMVRRDAFARAGLTFDEALSGSEDYDLCLRLSEVTALANLSEPLYRYRRHGASVSQSRRFDQLCRKAAALESAIRRREGAGGDFGLVGRDYLRAAISGHATGHSAAAVSDAVARALSYDNTLPRHTALVERTVRPYIPSSPSAALDFITTLFDDVLPASRPLSRLKRRLLSECLLSQAYLDAAAGHDVRRLIIKALAYHPSGLGDRDLMSLLTRQVLGRRTASSDLPTAQRTR